MDNLVFRYLLNKFFDSKFNELIEESKYVYLFKRKFFKIKFLEDDEENFGLIDVDIEDKKRNCFKDLICFDGVILKVKRKFFKIFDEFKKGVRNYTNEKFLKIKIKVIEELEELEEDEKYNKSKKDLENIDLTQFKNLVLSSSFNVDIYSY